ncbi:unnamed protein product [Microthlaspi erraticum]|uniref:F-box domain-containing protein n=1 Tax=Microthlaspi erraticum TaxID=1685480 RepID=A0A6D2HI10_9BRAS|nr:unnamed protein product [Microthlaspi erraticum]
MSDLPGELVEEILSRVPLTSLTAARSTCKPWNAYLRYRNQFSGYVVIDSELFSLEINIELERFRIKQVSIVNREICEVFQWDGLLLCVIEDDRWRFVWNPYLRQIKWIKPINDSHKFHTSDMYALGYEDMNNNNGRNHKILRLLDVSKCSSLLPFYEMYDFYSDSWKILHVNPGCSIKSGCVSLKGNSYFLGQEEGKSTNIIICFDFTKERFGRRFALPFGTRSQETKTVILSCVRDEQLAVLHLSKDHTMEIFIIRNIQTSWSWSWSKFLRVELEPSSSIVEAVSFVIHEEKKIALVSESHKSSRACIIGVDGYFKSVNIREAWKHGLECCYNQVVFSSYAANSVELHSNESGASPWYGWLLPASML